MLLDNTLSIMIDGPNTQDKQGRRGSGFSYSCDPEILPLARH